jgi:hypothetical protein
MKYYNVRTIEGSKVDISEFDIKHMKVVKKKDNYVLHLPKEVLNVDDSVINMIKFIYPYIKVIEI